MTVTYTLEVSTARLLGFAKLLFRWKGSIYRLMYKEMILFTALYYSVAFFYRSLLIAEYRYQFEQIAIYCRTFTDLIPLTFVMSFYVALVVNRWWAQYECIPWPDKTVMKISAYIQGADESSRMIRRSLARYLNLMAILVFRSTSTSILKRLPTLDHMLDAGLMTVDERLAFEDIQIENGDWWVPASWFSHLLMVARAEGRIADDLHLTSIMDEMHEFRGYCGQMFSYDWISVPLVYTQVVTLATYCFFLACLFGRQHLLNGDTPENSFAIDYYVPIFTFFQFFFYMGWLKVAEELICPYGEDDDDFDLNWVLDRNIEMSYAAVDTLYGKHPRLTRDAFWDDAKPTVPYTVATANYKKSNPIIGSTYGLNLHPGRKTHWEDEISVDHSVLENDDDQFYLVPPMMGGMQPSITGHTKVPSVVPASTVPGRIARRVNRLMGARRKTSSSNVFSSTRSLNSNWKPPTTKELDRIENLKRRRQMSTLEYEGRRKREASDATQNTQPNISFWADDAQPMHDDYTTYKRIESMDDSSLIPNIQIESPASRKDSEEMTSSSGGKRSNISVPALALNTRGLSRLSVKVCEDNLNSNPGSRSESDVSQQMDQVESTNTLLTPIAEYNAIDDYKLRNDHNNQ